MTSEVWDEITDPFPTWMVAQLKFVDGLIISTYTL